MRNEKAYARLAESTRIDPADLDRELLTLAQNQLEAGECTALAAKALADANAALKLAIATTAHMLRSDSSSNGGKQRSETQITSEVLLYEAVQQAQAAEHEADLDYQLWRSLADSLRTKTSGLTKVADLIVSGYMTPSVVRRDDINKKRVERRQARGESNGA